MFCFVFAEDIDIHTIVVEGDSSTQSGQNVSDNVTATSQSQPAALLPAYIAVIAVLLGLLFILFLLGFFWFLTKRKHKKR